MDDILGSENKWLGDQSESLVVYKFLSHKIPVSKPFGDNQSYDLIADINGKLLKIQTKTGRILDGNKLTVEVKHTYRKNGKYVNIPYASKDVDYFAIVCKDTKKVYLVHISKVEGKYTIVLNLSDPEECRQKKNVNFAKDYTFKKVIEDLKEEYKD